jgi:fibronectin type 3 domain-containing protein
MSRVDFDLSSGNTYSLAVGDLDKDGYLDIVIGNYGQTNRIYSFKGSRSPQSNSTMGTFEHNTYGISVGDIDKDGDLDIFVANNTQVNVLYTSQGNIFFNDTSASVLDDSRHSYKILMADIDSDGDYDLLCANGNLDSNTLIKAKSRRGFLAPIVSFLLSDSTPVTPPSAPSSITVTPVDKTSNQLQIRWHDNANNESSFVIYRSESSNVATKIQVGTSGANTTSFIDTTLNACTTYYYWVAAKNSAAESLSSSSEHGKTAPAAPVNLIASQGTVQKRIYLDWDVVSCAASYNVYEYNTTSSTWDMIGNVPNNLADTSLLDPSIIREYRVSSLDSSGNEGGLSYKFSGWGASDVPKNVQASKGQYTNGITLQWAPVQTCPNAQGVTARYINQFDLYGSNDNINFNKFDTYKIDTNLADGETSPSSDNPVSVWIPMSDTNHHYFMVTSVFKSDANCDGTYDNAVVYESNVADSVSTEGWAVAQQSETTSYPPAPTSINATDAQFCKIDISWASVSDASSYKLYRARSSFGPWSYLTTTSATAFTQYANAQHDIYVWTGYWYKVSAIVNGVEGYVSQYDGGYATRAIGIVDCY